MSSQDIKESHKIWDRVCLRPSKSALWWQNTDLGLFGLLNFFLIAKQTGKWSVSQSHLGTQQFLQWMIHYLSRQDPRCYHVTKYLTRPLGRVTLKFVCVRKKSSRISQKVSVRKSAVVREQRPINIREIKVTSDNYVNYSCIGNIIEKFPEFF